jgi:glyoxylase-like metal-dependent hydrolase (beta-lactamase superfamily II)
MTEQLPAALPAGVQVILAPNPSIMTGPGTNSYLIAGSEGRCAVVDPGPDDAGHLETLARASAGLGGLAYILVTHGHADHAEGAAHLRALTGAPVLSWSREGVAATDRTVADGERIVVGGRVLRALHTPGHRYDHLCFLLEDAGALFAGDLVAGVGTVVIVPPEGDLADYLASLQRLLALDDLRCILPGHGPVIDDGPALLREYVAHRLLRERQVLEGLRAGLTTISALVARIYADVDPALHAWAGRTVAAHLLKLEREGRVTRAPGAPDEGPWALVASAER